MLIAFLIFAITIGLVIWQPKGLGVGWSALAGAVIALLLGVVHWEDVVTVWGIVWNATITFVAIIVISLMLDAAGFFEWAALHVAKWGRGRGHRLFVLIILFGAIVSSVFANDGAALILTPIVIATLTELDFSSRQKIAFVMAAGFIADTGSLPLMISNLVNIVSAGFFGIGFNEYAKVMIPVGVVAVLASLIGLWLCYRQSIPKQYDLTCVKEPREVIRDQKTFVAGWVVLAVLLLGFFIVQPLGVPVSVIAVVAMVLLLLVANQSPVIKVGKILKEAPWQIVWFSLGMYLVVYGLRNAGLIHYLSELLNWFSKGGVWGAAIGTGVLAALLSSVMNNLPTVLVGALSVHASHAEGLVKSAMIYANVIGCDLGPKITPIGSLATLLWLHVLQKKGITITWGYYFKMGGLLTLFVLFLTLAALALWLSF